MPLLAALRERLSHIGPELAKFGLVGGIGAVIDLGGADVLHFDAHLGSLTAKTISITAATTVTYLGSRFWTFRHRANQHVVKETLVFAGLNIVGLAIALGVIALTHYGLGMTSKLEYNAASLLGTGLGTIFRYFAYKKWVFLEPEPVPVPSGRIGPAQEQLDPVGFWD